MTLPLYIRVFVASLYNETAISGYAKFRIGDIFERYGLAWKPVWADNFFCELQDQNFARVYRIGETPLDFVASIGAGGVHWVETQFSAGQNITSFLEYNGAVYTGEAVEIARGAIDSALWTGQFNMTVVSPQNRERLVTLLSRVEIDLEGIGASNSDKAMARAYVVAARALAESPEPPEDLIWELIDRANKLAGVDSLFVSVVALFASVAK